MQITTKYNVDDKVWIIHEGKAMEVSIYKLSCELYTGKSIEINYTLEITPYPNVNMKLAKEKECFSSRQELIDSL